MRKAALDKVAQLLAEDDRIVFVGSDLGAGTMDQVRRSFPDRVLMEGIAEQHLIGFAAGLAMEGMIPFVHTIATFLTRRSFEQITIDVALHDLPVRLLGAGGGLVYAPLGPTHEAIEDIALMRAVPGMTVVAPADSIEMENCIQLLVNHPGPAYIRMGKGGEVKLAGTPSPSVGAARILSEGRNLAILTTGVLAQECVYAVSSLDAFPKPTVAHFPFITPLDHGTVRAILEKHSAVLIVEEHVPSGGLFTAVVEFAALNGYQSRFFHLSLPQAFPVHYGSQQDHWQFNGLDRLGISSFIKPLVGQLFAENG